MRAVGSVVLTLVATARGLRTPSVVTFDRRGALSLAASALSPAVVDLEAASAAEERVQLYFGAGCFWHVQHQMFLEERATLKRTSAQISSRSGYAGGQRTGDGGKVCYHNSKRMADYGQLGHAEAVQVEIPVSSLPQFCARYFSLFGSQGYRHDPQDRGGEYRSLIGLPGGMGSPLFEVVQDAAKESPMRLVAGRGDEPDTLESKAVIVYDSNRFPFYSAELYHQFHNDFVGPPYGKAYNSLQDTLYKAGSLRDTSCPLPPQGFL